MKILRHTSVGRRAIAMTEYLIILAVVAIAAIAIVGLFGKQIQSVFVKSTASMQGSTASSTDATVSSTTQANMGNFDK
jgi:Flp pilus assembly pilin Flp